jgi:hypothetical protein
VTNGLAPLVRLPQAFRENAQQARRLAGSEAAAHVWEEAARETERRLQEALLEPLTIAQAELESGYTKSHLRRMLREGVIPNAGSEQGPLILRAHLPRKPGHGVDPAEARPASSRMQAARAVIEGG